jgi:hypothetical protein
LYNALRTLTYVWKPCKEHTHLSPIHFVQFLLPPLLPLVSQALQHICKVQQVSAISCNKNPNSMPHHLWHIQMHMPMFCFGQFYWFFESDNFWADIAHVTLLRKETCFSKFFLEKNSGSNKNLPPKKSLCCMQFSLYLPIYKPKTMLYDIEPAYIYVCQSSCYASSRQQYVVLLALQPQRDLLWLVTTLSCSFTNGIFHKKPWKLKRCSGGLYLTLHWYINITGCPKDLDHLIGCRGTSYNP